MKKIEKLAKLFVEFKIYASECYHEHSAVGVFQKMFPDDHYSRDLKTFLAFQNYIPERRGADLPWWGKNFFTKQTGCRTLIVSRDSLTEDAGSVVFYTHLMPIINNEVEYGEYTSQLNTKNPFKFNSWNKVKNQLVKWNVDLDFLYITDAMKVYKKGSRGEEKFNRKESKKLLEAEIKLCNPNRVILLGTSPLALICPKKNYAEAVEAGEVLLSGDKKYIVAPFFIGQGFSGNSHGLGFKKRLEIATDLIKSEC